MKRRFTPWLFGTAMIISAHTLGADLKWQVFGDLGAQYNSNPTKVEVGDEQDDTVVRALVGGRMYQDTEFLFLDFDYRATHVSWVDDTFGDRNTLEGYPRQLHGGVIALLLDGAMTNCLFLHGYTAVTAELKTRYHQPVETNKIATVRGWIEKASPRLYIVNAELEQEGAVKVTASAKFMNQPKPVVEDD